MELYFLRHGRADRSAWSGSDFDRPLTPEGRERMIRESQRLNKIGLQVDHVLTSPLVRARQTAEVFAEVTGQVERIVVDERLAHDFSMSALKAIVGDHNTAEKLLMVGHEPSFSAVIGELIGGAPVVCKKGCLARVDIPSSSVLKGELVWLLQPKTLIS